MGGLIASLIPLGIGVALSSSAIIAVILMLLSDRPLAKSTGFNVGWALAIIAVAALWLTPFAPDAPSFSAQSGASRALDAVLLSVGIAFLGVGGWRWRKGVARGAAVKMPRWMRAMDRMKPVLSPLAGAGVLLTNVKNLALTIAAAAAILGAGVSIAGAIAALLVFVVVASLLVVAPVVVYVSMPARSASILDSWRTWLVRHNWVMTVFLFGGLGIFLVLLGARGLASAS